MKKVLRLVITLAIIAGIVFGVMYIFKSKKTELYVYSTMTNENVVENVSANKINDNLYNFNFFCSNSSNEVYLTDEIKTSVTSGEYYKLQQSINYSQELLKYYYEKSALVVKQDSGIIDRLMESYNALLKQIETQKGVNLQLSNYVKNVSTPNKFDLKSYFNKMIAEYRKTFKAYAKFLYNFDNLITSDVYNGNIVLTDGVSSQICTKYLYQVSLNYDQMFSTINLSPLERYCYSNHGHITHSVYQNGYSYSGEAITEKTFVIAYNNGIDFERYLASENKTDFINNLPNKASYEIVATVVFGGVL